jgi:hypothetical protein
MLKMKSHTWNKSDHLVQWNQTDVFFPLQAPYQDELLDRTLQDVLCIYQLHYSKLPEQGRGKWTETLRKDRGMDRMEGDGGKDRGRKEEAREAREGREGEGGKGREELGGRKGRDGREERNMGRRGWGGRRDGKEGKGEGDWEGEMRWDSLGLAVTHECPGRKLSEGVRR